MDQKLISKDVIRKQSHSGICTLREIHAFCYIHNYKLIAEDKHWIIVEDAHYEHYVHDMLHHIMNDVGKVAKHFNDYY